MIMHTIRLEDWEVDKLLSILGMAEIEYAHLITVVCAQTGRPLPRATREWLADRTRHDPVLREWLADRARHDPVLREMLE